MEEIEPVLLKFENADALKRFMDMISSAAFNGRGLVICQGKCYGHAPELRDSLQEMVEMMDSGDEHGAGSEWHAGAKAVLAKAGG